jgi:hypothetical protein
MVKSDGDIATVKATALPAWRAFLVRQNEGNWTVAAHSLHFIEGAVLAFATYRISDDTAACSRSGPTSRKL